MAIGNGLILGSGLSAGASNFLQAYMSVANQAHAEKLQQNAGLVNIIMDRMKDENTPLRDRARMMDMIPGLLGIKKMKRRLSHELGLTPEFLDSVAESAVAATNAQTIAGSPEVAGQAGTKDTYASNVPVDTSGYSPANVPYSNANATGDKNIPLPSSLNDVSGTITGGQDVLANASGVINRGTQATNTIPATPDTIIPATPGRPQVLQGDLTPNLIKRKQAREDSNYELQQKKDFFDWQTQEAFKAAKYEGYTNLLGRTVDEDGKSWVTMSNAAGEVKEFPLRGRSEVLEKASLTGNRPSSALRQLEDYYIGHINPATQKNYTQQEAYDAAVTDLKTQFDAKLAGTQANTARNVAAAGGLTPIQPAQAAVFQRQRAKDLYEINQNISKAEDELNRSGDDAGRSADATHSQYETKVKPLEDQINVFFKNHNLNPAAPKLEDLDDDERKEFNGINGKLSAARTEYYRLQGISNKAAARYTAAATAHQNAAKNKTEYLNNAGDTDATNNPQAQIQRLLQRADVQQKIATARNNPKNKGKLDNLSDAAIAQWLLENGYIPN